MNSVFKIVPEAVAISSATDKTDILGQTTQLFAKSYGLDELAVADALDEREKLGSTGFGRGVAIPHARTDGIKRPVAALLKLESPVDFDAADGMPVELVFGLLSPHDCGATHLHALAAISRLARDDAAHSSLLDAPSAEALFALLTDVVDRDAA